jgi:prepilin peptidase CpaA
MGQFMEVQFIPIFLLLVLLVAAVSDVRIQKIPNWLTFSAVVVGLACHTGMNGFAGFLFSLQGALLGLGFLILFYLAAGMGAGDVKLMAAVGGLLGPKGVFWAFIYTALIGGIVAVTLLLWKAGGRETLQRYGRILRTLILTHQFIYVPAADNKRMPVLYYGVVIALGTTLYVLRELI